MQTKIAGAEIEVLGGGAAPGAEGWSLTVVEAAPRWIDGTRGEYVALERAWQEGLVAARDAGAKHVVVSAAGIGDKGFPMDRASYVVWNTVARYLIEERPGFERITFYASTGEEERVYGETLREVTHTMIGWPPPA